MREFFFDASPSISGRKAPLVFTRHVDAIDRRSCGVLALLGFIFASDARLFWACSSFDDRTHYFFSERDDGAIHSRHNHSCRKNAPIPNVSEKLALGCVKAPAVDRS